MTEVINNDPDHLECYSDHASDIAYYGECSYCGSSEPNVTEHVLPEVERQYGLDPIAAAELVMSDQTGRIFDGVFLDLFTASAIVAVANALNDNNQATLRSWPLVKAADACFRLINKEKS